MQIFAFLSGCATPIRFEFAPETVEKVYSTNYQLNQAATAAVGQAVVQVSDYHVKKTPARFAKINTNATIKWGVFNVDLSTQRQYRIWGSVSLDSGSYSVVDYKGFEDGQSKPLAALVRADGTVLNRGAVIEPGQGLFQSLAELTLVPSDAKFLFVATQHILHEKGYVNFEISYSGINASGINFTYREFDPKSPTTTAYFQNLTYEPGAKEIAVKNIVISIEEANSKFIKYRVLSDGR